MQPLLEAIYRYIMENEVNYYMDQGEYEENSKYLDLHKEALESTLTEAQKEHLEIFLESSNALEFIQAEAIFCAALSAGLSLGALHRP